MTEQRNLTERKSKNRGRVNRELLLAFVLPVFAMLVIFMGEGIYPFGNRSFLRTDLYNQYAPFFSELWHKLRNGDSLFYSWNIGIGSNFVALLAYYLASPLNWLVALVPQTAVIEFVTYLIVLKMGLSGLSFTWFLCKKYDAKSYAATCFGVAYAMSGYMAAYSWNIMWLDCMVLAPIILLGVEKLVKEKNGFLYGVSLGASILTNFYISIMICMFVVLYFALTFVLYAYENRVSVREGGVTILRFAVYSLLAGGFGGILLIPEYFALQLTRSATVKWPSEMKSYFSFIDMVSRHLFDAEVEIGLDHWPNVYCGVAVLILLPLYILNQHINWKEKVGRLGLLGFLALSFSNNFLDMIWHGLHFPDSLPARHSFLYIILLLMMCFEAVYYLKGNSLKEIWYSVGYALLFIVICEKLVQEEFVSYTTFLVSALFVVIYAVFLLVYRKRKRCRRLLLSLVLCTAIVETGANMALTSVATVNRDSYCSDWEGTKDILAYLEKENPGFYRIEKSERRTKNDGGWLGYPGASLFSSTNNDRITQFYEQVGMLDSKNAFAVNGATPLMEAMLSIKYTLSEEVDDNDPFKTWMMVSDGICLYQNTDTLPLGYVISPDVEKNWKLETGTSIAVQNSLVEALGVETPLLTHVESNSDKNQATCHAPYDGHYYFYLDGTKATTIKVSVTGEDGTESREVSHKQTNKGYLIPSGYVKAGSLITLEATTEDALNGEAYYFSQSSMKEAVAILGKQTMELEEYTSTYVKGQIAVREKGKLVLTIPLEKGWSVKVDGQKIAYDTLEENKFAGVFVGLVLEEGEHTIEMSFHPYGFYVGAVLSVISLIIFLVLCVYKRKHPYLPIEMEETGAVAEA